MKSAVRFITVIIILLLLVSCVPTETKVQEAIMQTQAAQPTATSTPEPTATATLEPTPTNTPEPTIPLHLILFITSKIIFNFMQKS
jgi:hypothetical protein